MAKKKAEKPGRPCTEPAADVIEAPVNGTTTSEGWLGGTLWNRTQVGEVLDCSVSTVRRKEGKVLNPIVAPNGTHLFRADEVETVRRVRVKSEQTPAHYDGPTAARVFALLDEGLHPVEVVKRTSLDPRAVAAIRNEWALMLGGFVVTERHLVELEMMAWIQAAYPMRDADALVAALRDSALGELCAKCKAHPSDFCGHCVDRFAEAEEAAKRATAERARAEELKRRREIERSNQQSLAKGRRSTSPKAALAQMATKTPCPTGVPADTHPHAGGAGRE